MKPGTTMRLVASITAASSLEMAMFGRTSRILPFSIRTSACAKSPIPRSRVRTTPPLRTMRRWPCTRASSPSASAAPAPCARALPARNGATAAPAANPALAVSSARRDGAGVDDAAGAQQQVSGVVGFGGSSRITVFLLASRIGVIRARALCSAPFRAKLPGRTFSRQKESSCCPMPTARKPPTF